MTLDDAIEHAEEVARTCDDKACAAEHTQLAEWLSLLKVYTDTHMAEEVQRARHEMHGWQLEWKREMERREELEAENKKLRVDWESERDYANQMEAIAERLKAENAKLRKYAESYVGVVKAGGCDLCPYCEDFETCEDADAEPMSEGCALYMQMSELGIEA